MQICDAHCHFFSSRFLELLTKDLADLPAENRARAVCERLRWDDPGRPMRSQAGGCRAGPRRRVASRADREHSRRRGVGGGGRPAASRRGSSGSSCSIPGRADAAPRLERALRRAADCAASACFPRCTATAWTMSACEMSSRAAATHGAAVFVHCGVLTVGVRKKLGLPSPFDLRLGDPLAVAAVGRRLPRGAGDRAALRRRPASRGADGGRAVRRTSISTRRARTAGCDIIRGLTLDAVFRQALEVAGPDRILFGTDSSFFPRGWNRRSTRRSGRRSQRRERTMAGRPNPAGEFRTAVRRNRALVQVHHTTALCTVHCARCT